MNHMCEFPWQMWQPVTSQGGTRLKHAENSSVPKNPKILILTGSKEGAVSVN